MDLKINGTRPANAKYNASQIQTIKLNGNVIWNHEVSISGEWYTADAYAPSDAWGTQVVYTDAFDVTNFYTLTCQLYRYQYIYATGGIGSTSAVQLQLCNSSKTVIANLGEYAVNNNIATPLSKANHQDYPISYDISGITGNVCLLVTAKGYDYSGGAESMYKGGVHDIKLS